MKNLKIRYKLILSFLIMLVIAAAVGAVGMIGMLSLSRADTSMYENNVLAINSIGLIRENFALQRLANRNLILYDPETQHYRESAAQLSALEDEMETHLTDYTKAAAGNAQMISAFVDAYDSDFKNIKKSIIEYSSLGDKTTSLSLLDSAAGQLTSGMINELSKCYEYNLQMAGDAIAGNTKLSHTFIIALSIAIIISGALSVFLALYLSNIIAKPLGIMTAYFEKVAATGDMSLSENDHTLIEACSKIKDEIGLCISTTAAFVGRILKIGDVMGAVADGDLTVELELLSAQDTMGISLKKMTESLSGMFGDINHSTVQVSAGSRQIAGGSQILAQGATQQAAAVEQLTSSISDVSNKIKVNADMASSASKLAASIKSDAEKGSRQMENMLTAVKDIEEASASISRVIKVIDDIAFQTNILALNAAVEAARAGQHGKGFAVVAEEVRNLAAKSAEAARNTGGLIANSMEKSELGAHIAADTASSLSEIVAGINESGRIVADIAKSSEEQAIAMNQINKGVEQVGQVIQQNSATAQQAAAASEEMSEQAALLEKMAARFKVKDTISQSSVPITHFEPQERPLGPGVTGKY